MEDEYTITIECPYNTLDRALLTPEQFALFIDGAFAVRGKAYRYDYDTSTKKLRISLMTETTVTYEIAANSIVEVRFYPNSVAHR